ncbi:MAG: M14 family metallopeptidase, partial [Vicinamibacterales bacterium]
MATQSTLPPATRAEQTGFEETSRYADVRRFIDELAATAGSLRVESFGKSEEGRDLPLLVVGDPSIAAPQQAIASRRPIIFAMANIHAGEVEGKEALLHLARRLTLGDLRPLARGAVWLLAPIYNADGNERIGSENRREQNGPIGGVGTRENALGLDLNRDFIKLESAEAQALVGLLNKWNPDLVIDLHTTNGSYHGYHLTYAPSLNPNADPRLTAFLRQRLLPSVTRAMSSKHGLRTYYYGNFSTAESPGDELSLPDSSGASPTVWRTFDHRPRFGNNYVGLRNRLAILSEAYSYLDFTNRVRATEAFVEEIGRFVIANASNVQALINRVEADWLRGASATEGGVAFDIRPLAEPARILVGAVEKRSNPRTGTDMLAMIERTATPMRMLEYGAFAATTTRRMPRAYVIAPSASGVDRTIAGKLKAHGARVGELTAATRVTVERFVVESVSRSEPSFQGHNEVSVTGRFERADTDLPAGTLVIGTDQPLGRLIF